LSLRSFTDRHCGVSLPEAAKPASFIRCLYVVKTCS
jgi:hypothetical protein